MPTWEDNRRFLSDLWPNYEPTDAERDLYRDALSGLDQDEVREAIRDVRASTKNDFKPPLSDLIHVARQRIANKRSAQRQPRSWVIADHELETERTQAVAKLEALPPDRLKLVIEFAYRTKFVTRDWGIEAKPIADWSRACVMVILSLEALMRENPSRCERLLAMQTQSPTLRALPRGGKGGATVRREANGKL